MRRMTVHGTGLDVGIVALRCPRRFVEPESRVDQPASATSACRSTGSLALPICAASPTTGATTTTTTGRRARSATWRRPRSRRGAASSLAPPRQPPHQLRCKTSGSRSKCYEAWGQRTRYAGWTGRADALTDCSMTNSPLRRVSGLAHGPQNYKPRRGTVAKAKDTSVRHRSQCLGLQPRYVDR